MQEKPEEAERLKDKQVRSSEEDTIFGVRMGAGDRSYLVRDKKIEVLRNVRGGVEVRHLQNMQENAVVLPDFPCDLEILCWCLS